MAELICQSVFADSARDNIANAIDAYIETDLGSDDECVVDMIAHRLEIFVDKVLTYEEKCRCFPGTKISMELAPFEDFTLFKKGLAVVADNKHKNLYSKMVRIMKKYIEGAKLDAIDTWTQSSPFLPKPDDAFPDDEFWPD